MGDITLDITGLKKYQKQLEKLDAERFFEAATKETAGRLLRAVVKRTPVDTGELRRNWSTSNSTLKVKKSGKTYCATIINSKKYASYVEYGHRTANGSGWVNGAEMLTKSEEEIRNAAPQFLQRKLDKWIKEAGK